MFDPEFIQLLESKNILLTGGRGFIGTQLGSYLKKFGANVIKLDREASENMEAIDFNNYEQMKSSITRINAKFPIDFIFHLAGEKSTGACRKDSLKSLSNAFNGTINLLESCRVLDRLDKFILISSIGIYGSDEDGYTDDYQEINSPKSESIYSSTKVITESLGLAYAKEFKIPTIITRLSNVYGPNQPQGALIPDLISQISNLNDVISMGSPVAIRDFIHIDDVVSGLTSLIVTKNLEIGDIYNISSGEGHSVKQILEWMVEYSQFSGLIMVDPSKVRVNEKLCLVASNNKLKAATHWYPNKSLKEGLRELCQIMKQK
jgi:nucleoside-diphosphate-sugar epimerase